MRVSAGHHFLPVKVSRVKSVYYSTTVRCVSLVTLANFCLRKIGYQLDGLP